MGKKKAAINAFKVVFTAITLFFLVRYVFKYWQEIPTDRIKSIWPSLLVSLAILTLLRVYQACLWGKVLTALGGKLPVLTALTIHTRALLSRYIPGNLWPGLGISYLCHQQGVPVRISVTSWVLETTYTVLGGALAAIVTAPWWLIDDSHAQFGILCALVPIGLLAVHPRILCVLISAPLRILGKTPPEIPLSFLRSAVFALLYVLLFLSQGLVLSFVAMQVEPGHPINPLALAGISAAAWTVGFLSFITPSGIGVREGVMSLMLARVLPAGSAVLLPIIMRILMTLAEVVAAAIPYGTGAKSAATVDVITENLSSVRSEQ